MKVLIEIPEHVYEHAKETSEDSIDETTAMRAIANGTPLPKGHGDLIDVNRKITVPLYDFEYDEYSEKTMTVLDALNKWSDEGVTINDVIIFADESEGGNNGN